MAGARDTVRKLPVEEAVTRDGLAKLEEGIRGIITEMRHQQSSNFATLHGEINALYRDITSRDILLRKLEESVTRLSEDIAPLKDYVTAKMQEEGHSAMSQSSGSPEDGALQDGDQETEAERNNRVQNRCVDVMMSLTEIRKNDEAKTKKVRGFYEKIYKASPFTSLMLKFLERNRGVKVLIDCDSDDISNLVRRLVSLDGEKCDGKAFFTFVEFNERKVYLGGKPGKVDVHKKFDPEVSLAQSLAQMVMYLIFKNRGFPYECDDDQYEKLYEKIVQEASQKNENKVITLIVGPIGPNTAGVYSYNMDDLIHYALNKKSSLAREVSLISVVPGILVKFGSKEGMSKLLERLPFLTFFFMQHVIPKMRSIVSEV